MNPQYILFYFLIIIPSAIVHEYAHGFMADRLGDKTARYAGRLTLNPKAHIDLWGTILMPLLLLFLSGGNFVFGYAKPVPYNPYNLRNQKWGPAAIAIAGPMANFILAFGFAILFRIFFALPIAELFAIIVYVNVLLLVFNLVPIPPLDGSKVLFAILPDSAYKVKNFLERNGFIFLLIFIFFLFELITPIIEKLFYLLIG
jgi:Zn-dependent protease